MTKIIKTYNNFMSNSTPENWFSIRNLFLRHIVNNKARKDLDLCVLRDCYDKYVNIKFIVKQRHSIKNDMFYRYNNWRY